MVVAVLVWAVLIAIAIAVYLAIGIFIVRKGVEAGIMRATANLVELGMIPVQARDEVDPD
jgi:hypothetical protein